MYSASDFTQDGVQADPERRFAGKADRADSSRQQAGTDRLCEPDREIRLKLR